VVSCYRISKDTLHEIHEKEEHGEPVLYFEKNALTEMCFFLNTTVFKEGKHSPTLKRDLCCHGNVRNKTCEARDCTFSIRYCELIITKEESGRYCLTCLIGWKDTVCEGQTGKVVEQRQGQK
jgi:hypothetical protein